jgi:hypothetical protein
MDSKTSAHFANLDASDADARYAAYMALLAATNQPVDWAYDVWDELVADLRHPDNHRRSIAAQLLGNLAKSDPKHRILKDLDALLALTHDPKFVTARHTLQSLWKIGLVSPKHRQRLLQRLSARFAEAAAEKNGTLVRYDLLEGLRKLYDQTRDPKVKTHALDLIQTEPDPKYQKKYTTLWRGV